MILKAFLVCSFIVQYPDRIEYIDIVPCKNINTDEAAVKLVKLREKYKIPSNLVVTATPYTAAYAEQRELERREMEDVINGRFK